VVKQLRRRWWQLLLAVVALAMLGFVLWATIIPSPMPEALAALQSDAQVEVTTEHWLLFRPVRAPARVGLVLYPGGRVDYRSYAPAAHAIAAEGFLVAIVPMPLNLAVLGADRAQGVIRAHPEVSLWAVGGHSLGGSMAAQFARRHPGEVAGLVLWAAYPAGSDNLAATNMEVVSIFATRDGLTSLDDIERSRQLLPPTTVLVPIEGGNHAQFGWYGPQSGDGEPTISREVQQAHIVAGTVQLLEKLRTQ